MSEIVFFYGAMNSGKSASLLQSNFNYLEKGLTSILFIPKIVSNEYIVSRTGLSQKATVFDENFIFDTYLDNLKEKPNCIMIDEAQFLKKNQIWQLCKLSNNLQIRVLCYGLRSDFKGEPFEGSQYLLTLADKLVELETICICGNKATMNMRKKKNTMEPIIDGNQVEIGGNDTYVALCRKCYYNLTISI